MFLAQLDESQKRAFMTLAHELVWVDGVLDKGELSAMNQYKQEMGLSASYDESQGDMKQAIAVFSSAPAKVKKAAVLELVALANAGADYEQEESTLIEKIQADLELDDKFISECNTCTAELTALYRKIETLVNQ